MDYQKIAEEFLRIHATQLKIPENRQISRLVKGELFVLDYLLTHGNTAYPKDLRDAMDVSTARIAAILNQMEKKQWIIRRPDSRDSRKTIVTITGQGRAKIEKSRMEIVGNLARMLEAIGPDDAREFLRIQKKMADSMQKSF